MFLKSSASEGDVDTYMAVLVSRREMRRKERGEKVEEEEG